MSFYSSITFTKKHEEEVNHLLDFNNLEDDKKVEFQNKFKEFLDKWKPARCLYILEEESEAGYKIGIANDVHKRVKQLQTGNPHLIEIVSITIADIDDQLGLEIPYLEKFLHKNFKHKKISGEWFDLTIKEVIDVVVFLEVGRNLETEFSGIGLDLVEYEKRKNKIEEYAT